MPEASLQYALIAGLVVLGQGLTWVISNPAAAFHTECRESSGQQAEWQAVLHILISRHAASERGARFCADPGRIFLVEGSSGGVRSHQLHTVDSGMPRSTLCAVEREGAAARAARGEERRRGGGGKDWEKAVLHG